MALMNGNYAIPANSPSNTIADNKMRSELQCSIDGIENAITDLTNAAQLLLERLGPVTSQYAVSTKAQTHAAAEAPRAAPSCVTIGRLQELTERLYAIRAVIGEQHDALVV